jgi:hypothetical protein
MPALNARDAAGEDEMKTRGMVIDQTGPTSSPAAMAHYNDPGTGATPYSDKTPMPGDVPPIQEIGATSAPLKSAAFFIGAKCKDFNGAQ